MTFAELPQACERCRTPLDPGALFCPQCGTARARKDGDPLVGEVVADRYLLRERLGHGTSGTIYLAEHVTLRRRVAVKILHHELSRDDLAVERFRREATTVGEIDNEHIVEVLDFGRTVDGRLFLAMELLEGEALSAAIERQGKLPVDQVVDVLIQVGQALMEAHAMGYVHRDLRPRNVFLTRRRGRPGFVKLLDFGLAKLVEAEGEAASTSLGMTFGDPRYMSPEQARGEAIDRRADIYSLGVMAYEMLTGKPPFVGKKVFDVLTQHLEATAPPPSAVRGDVPAWLDAVVTRMLAKRPEERFATVYRLVEALEQGRTTGKIMSDEAAQSMPAIVPPPPAPRSRETGAVREMPREEIAAAASASASGPAATAPPAAPAPGPASGPRSSEMSGAWFADGEAFASEALDEDDGLRPSSSGSSARHDRTARTRAASASSSMSTVFPPEGRPAWIKWALIGAGIVVALLVVILAWPSGKKKAAAPVAAPVVVPDAAPAVVEAPPAVDAGAPVAVAKPRTGGRRPVVRDDDDDDSGDPSPLNLTRAGQPDAGEPASKDPPIADEAKAQAEFFVKLGQKALAEGDVVAAATNFNKARAQDNRNADAIAGLGELALRQNAWDDAVVHLDAAARLAPRSARIQILRGQAWLGAGDAKKAATAFKAALKADPDNPIARKGYEEAARRGGE